MGRARGRSGEGERPLRICPFALSRARAEPLLRCVGVCCSGSAGPTMTCLQVQPSVPTGAPSGHSPAFGVENHVPIPLQRPNVMSKCFRRMGQLVAHVCGAQAWVGGGGGGGKAREGEGEGLTAGKRGRESRCVLGPTSSPPGCSCTESTSPAAASFAARSRRCCGCRAGAHRLALWPGSMLRLE